MSPKTIIALLDDIERSAGFVRSVETFASATGAHIVFDVLVAAPVFRPELAPLGVVYTLPAELEALAQDSGAKLRAMLSRDRHDTVITDMDDVAWLPGDVRYAHRVADLVVAGSDASWSLSWLRRRVLETLILAGGTPLLLLPAGGTLGRVDHAVLGWKPAAAAIRAARDMLPLLAPGARISIVAVDGRMDEPPATGGATIVSLFERHGFTAAFHAVERNHSTAQTLQAWALEHDADLLATGAFAHSRIREAALGGVTRELLHGSSLPTLLSH